MGRNKTKRRPLIPGWVFYGRTSDEDAQAPERSLGSQRRLCAERLINGSGLEPIGEYTDIYSGRSIDRKNYQLLLSDARDGRFSHVAIAFVDRFGRNDVEGIRASDELNKLGVTVRIATYPRLDPAMADGRMIVTMLFGVAQFEAARISERCREGMHSKLLGGDWAWKAPDGYVNREEKLSSANLEDKLKHAKYKRWIEIDPEQSKVWRYAWDLLLTDTMSLRQICEALHAKGYRLRSGGPFVKLDSNGRYSYAINIQIPNRMHNIQVDEKCLRHIRELYVHQLEDLVGRPNTDERATLEKALKDLAEEELRCARLHAKQQVSDETWATLWKEWQDQRGAIKANLEAMDRNCQTHIATLDEALKLIGKAGILFDRLPESDQQDLLRHMVKRVVINPEGPMLRMDLQPPFSYLQGLVTLAKGEADPNEPQNGSRTTKRIASRRYATGSSIIPLGEPGGTRTLNQRIKSPMLYH